MLMFCKYLRNIKKVCIKIKFSVLSDLGNNSINSLPEKVFQDLLLLEHLFLDRNRLEKLPLNQLNFLNKLEWLDLSCNLITMENDKFPKLNSILEM